MADRYFQLDDNSKTGSWETAEKIWKYLNQEELTGLDTVDQPFSTSEVQTYFKESGQSKLINLLKLSEPDRDYLAEAGFSLSHLAENYLTPCSADKVRQDNAYSHKSRRSKLRIQEAVLFQTPMIEAGYLAAICPATGKVLQSTISFPFFNFIAYRFVGQEVFYLITHDFWGERTALFFPERDLVIQVAPTPFNLRVTVTTLKTELTAKWRTVEEYIRNPEHKQKVGLIRRHHFAHHLWNELSALERLAQNNQISLVDRLLVAAEPIGKISDLFPEISDDRLVRVETDRFLEVALKNHYCVVSLGDCLIPQSLLDRVRRVSLQRCSDKYLETIQRAREHHSLLLWISIRLGSRTWNSQIDGLIKILSQLNQQIANLGVVVDGFSYPDAVPHSAHEGTVLAEQEMIQILKTSLPELEFYSLVGGTLHESFAWAQVVDLYLAHQGTLQHKVGWIGHKPGVVHTNTVVLKSPLQMRPGTWEVENGVLPVYVSSEYVTDIEEKVFLHGQWRLGASQNYECDWQHVCGLIQQVVSHLPQSESNQNTENEDLSMPEAVITNSSSEEEARSMNYRQVLKRLHSKFKPRNYVEIGVFVGQTLALANVPSIGIDPKFKIDCDIYGKKEWVKLFQMTSNAFFEKYSLYEELGFQKVHFSFIDGLHLFEQVLQDFINIERYAAKDALVVFHDVIPPNYVSTKRKRESQLWVGDVWKITQCLQKYRDDLDLTIINTPPSGLLLVKNLDSSSRVLSQHYDEICDYYLNHIIDDEETIDAYLKSLKTVTPETFFEMEVVRPTQEKQSSKLEETPMITLPQ